MPTTLPLSLLILSATAMIALAQGGKGGAAPAEAKPGGEAPSVFIGKSANANLQEALNDALQQAQLTLTKTVADARFDYQVDAITGTRGGFAGTNEIKLKIKVLP